MNTIAELVDDLRQGKMVILTDDETRENEGDLVLAADFVTPESINFMARFARGLICLTLTKPHCEKLQLPLMVSNNGAAHGTNFTLSIEAATGVTTGISAADRAHTIKTAVAKHVKPSDLVQPGHIFPLMAQDGGVLMRAGHTEAGCDLTRMAGLTPASVICEIMNDDGSMARLPDLQVFAKEHNLKMGTIADLIEYRNQTESLIERIGNPTTITTAVGEFQAIAYRDHITQTAHLALIHGDLNQPDQIPLVRVHEPVCLLDVLEVKKRTHSLGIFEALTRLQEAPSGVLVLLNCQPDSALFFNTFHQLDQATTTSCSNNASDLRVYGIGAQILRDLSIQKMRLLSKPRKMPSMAGFGLEITQFETF
jgi:3,4-dihydroxy 2-butanone 4-phosphate synthase / GTP cyclohydrolase II